MALTHRTLTLLHLDGRPWASAGFTGPGDAWGWIAETVATEHGADPEDVHCEESEDGDLVTLQGAAMYRISYRPMILC